ncbi:MAG: hypothetical protein ACD_56C00088G0004 [uncultured bacterium]|nr:MAG: hypothetical protein ACD_56C00088G0004 [uncultured bacterium]KKQ44605.1 MAG: hypothetical protein US63_C0025G0010 [Candidatus Moranbacteria bacterium GW2011_GWC2_37_8]KKQ63243.1 MAG: hypothetical protein US82_C0002G0038 [Parcubacteria group bacterium GW2011_GWC1_38_22]KKQ79603.1 MAG: hypothetical protein UT03_C0047G0004 [Candidatus Moranbacteria bacterium GW2011_GWD2_38_7]
MESIFLIIKITNYNYSQYDFHPSYPGDGWELRGSHCGSGTKREFHSAHTTKEEAELELSGLWYAVIKKNADPDDPYSPVCYHEDSGYIILELQKGTEMFKIEY